MKIKNVELKFYAFVYDWNTKSLIWTNVLGDRYKDRVCKKIKKDEITNVEELKEDLKNYLMYHYWCKSEYEILVGDLLSSINPEKYVDYMVKLDVYSQVIKNIDVMVNYIINTMKIEFRKEK